MQTASVIKAEINESAPQPGVDQTIRFFWILMSVHVAVYMLVCLLTQPNLPLDMVEMLFWGQQWQLGYHKHPPLPAWITASAWGLGGRWLVYLVSQLTIVATFWAVWQFAREKLSPSAALCSVFILEGCYYCSYMINDINNTIITRPFWALAILFLYRAITRENRATQNRYWVLTGIVIGLGMISKYYMGILVLAMALVPIVSKQARKCLSTPGPWLTTAVALLIFAPHFAWMCQNDFITLDYVLRRSGEESNSWSLLNHLSAPLDFLKRQLPAVIPVLLLATPLYFNRDKNTARGITNSDRDFFGLYLTIVFAGPILIYLLIGTLTGGTIRSMWGGPLFSFLGVLLFATFHTTNQAKYKKILRESICIGAVMAIALAGRNTLGPTFRDKFSRIHFPGSELSEVVNSKWNDRYGYPLPSVGGELFIAGCAAVYSPEHVDVYCSMSQQASPWIDDESFQNKGGVVVWEKTPRCEATSEEWLQRFQQVEVLEDTVLTSHAISDSKEVSVGIAIIHPTSSEFANLKRRHPDEIRAANSNRKPVR